MFHLPVSWSKKRQLVPIGEYIPIKGLDIPFLKEEILFLSPEWVKQIHSGWTPGGMMYSLLWIVGGGAMLAKQAIEPLTEMKGCSLVSSCATEVSKAVSSSAQGACLFWNNKFGSQVADRGIWDDIMHGPLAFFFDEQEDGSLVANMEFGEARVKEGLFDLNCKITVRPDKSVEVESDAPEGDVETASRIAHCAILTDMVVGQHFAQSHMLTVQTIFPIANQCFSNTHPIYELIWNHGFAANRVDVEKGPGLIQCLLRDWSFDEENLVKFILHRATKQYDIMNMREKAKRCHQGLDLFVIMERYVQDWVEASGHKLDDEQIRDKELVEFWTRIKKYAQFQSIGDLTGNGLAAFLTGYVWLSIFFHNYLGDSASYIQSCPRVPKSKDFQSKQALWSASRLFDFVATVVFQPAFPLSADWTSHMKHPFRSIAERFQFDACSVSLPDPLECGVNK